MSPYRASSAEGTRKVSLMRLVGRAHWEINREAHQHGINHQERHMDRPSRPWACSQRTSVFAFSRPGPHSQTDRTLPRRRARHGREADIQRHVQAGRSAPVGGGGRGHAAGNHRRTGRRSESSRSSWGIERWCFYRLNNGRASLSSLRKRAAWDDNRRAIADRLIAWNFGDYFVGDLGEDAIDMTTRCTACDLKPSIAAAMLLLAIVAHNFI